MTNPITPDPSLHTDITSKRNFQQEFQAARASLIRAFSDVAPEFVQLIVNAVLAAFGLSAIEGDVDALLAALESAMSDIPGSVIASVFGGASLGADVQLFMSSLGADFPLSFPFTFGTSTNTTVGSFVTLDQFNALVDGLANNGLIGNDITQAIAAYRTGLAAAKSQISQAILDGINSVPGAGTAVEKALTEFPYVNVTSILGNSHLGADVQAIVTDATAALGGATSTLAGFIAALEAIPPVNISNVLGGANLGADVQAIVTQATLALGGATSTLAGFVAKLEAIPFTNVASALGLSNLGADIQSVLSSLGTMFPITFPFTFGTSSNTSVGSFASLDQFNALVDGLVNNGNIGNDVTAAIAAVQSLHTTAKADISQAILDGVNAVEGAGTAIEQALTAIPKGITGLFNNLTGANASQATQDQANTALANSASSFAGHSALLGALNSTTFNGGTNAVVDFWEYANGNLPGSLFTGITSGGGGGGNLLQVQNGFVVSTFTGGPDYYAYSTGFTTDYQSVGIVLTTLQGENSSNQLFVRGNSGDTAAVFASFSQDPIHGPTVQIGAYGPGVVNGGTGLVTFNFIPNAYYQLIAGTVGSLYQFYVLCNGIPICSWLDINQGTSVGINNRYGGFTSVYNGPPYGNPSPVAQFTIADQELYIPGSIVVSTVASLGISSSTYSNTGGYPSASVLIGSSGLCRVSLYMHANPNPSSGRSCGMTIAATGAKTILPGTFQQDTYEVFVSNGATASNFGCAAGAQHIISGCTPGATLNLTTYFANNSGGTITFGPCELWAEPL